MPERRSFRGQMVKNAKRVIVKGQPHIRLTLVGQKGQPGPQLVVTVEEYDSNVVKTFVPGSSPRSRGG